jgi:hypothetical protein
MPLMRRRFASSKLFALAAISLASCFVAANVALGISAVRPVVIYDGVATELAPSSPFAETKLANSGDLWVTFADLTRATGYEVKPQGVCRHELCFPIPNAQKAEFLAQQGSAKWFNLSAFARLLKQPVAHDETTATWYFGSRPDLQNNYLSSLAAPNFTLPDVNGNLHSLADFRGKKVLLVTWASW